MHAREYRARFGVAVAMLGATGFGWLSAHGGEPFANHWVVFVATVLVSAFGVYNVARAVQE